MKNIKLLLAVCATFLFGTCCNGQQPNFDLVFCELQGPVKTCDYYEFDRSGRLVSVDGIDPFTLESPTREFDTVTFDFTDVCKWIRNDKGQISTIECYEGIQEFTWSDGRVKESIAYFEAQKTLTVNEYDAQGRIVKQTLYNGMEDEDVESKDDSMFFATIEYTYLEFDSHGNWIRRIVKWSDPISDYVDEQEEPRNIKYYE